MYENSNPKLYRKMSEPHASNEAVNKSLEVCRRLSREGRGRIK